MLHSADQAEELPGYWYDATKRRYYRNNPPSSAPSDCIVAKSPSHNSSASRPALPLTRYLLHRSLGLSPLKQPGCVVAQCRLAVWPAPSRCDAISGASVIVRRPIRLEPVINRHASNRWFSMIVHTGCSVDAVPGMSSGGLLEESRTFRLKLVRHRKSASLRQLQANSACHRVLETKSPASYSASVGFDLKSSPNRRHLFAIAGFLSRNSSNTSRRLLLKILPRKFALSEDDLTVDQGDALSAFPRASINIGLRWPAADRGDQIVDLRVSAGSDFQTGLAGRRTAFCIPSLSSCPASDLSPLCVADSPIVGLDASLLASSSRLMAICCLEQLLLADTRAGRVVASIAASLSPPSRPRQQSLPACHFTACRFLASAAHGTDPRLIVADTPQSVLVYDIRHSGVPLAILSPRDSGDVRRDTVGHRASWLQLDPVSGLVARTDPDGVASVWCVNFGCSGSVPPLLTVSPSSPTSGGLALPAFVDAAVLSSEAEFLKPAQSAGLAILDLPAAGGCGISFWPIAL